LLSRLVTYVPQSRRPVVEELERCDVMLAAALGLGLEVRGQAWLA
jgi:hypothetical protein